MIYIVYVFCSQVIEISANTDKYSVMNSLKEIYINTLRCEIAKGKLMKKVLNCNLADLFLKKLIYLFLIGHE